MCNGHRLLANRTNDGDTRSQLDQRHAPLNCSVALSPTFVLVWKLALEPGSRVGSKSHCPRNATALSGTGAVLAVLVGVDAELLELALLPALSTEMYQYVHRAAQVSQMKAALAAK